MVIFKSSTFGTISGRHGEAVAMDAKLTGRNHLRLYRNFSDPESDKQLINKYVYRYPDTEEDVKRNMLFPYPQSEISNNSSLTDADQNYEY